MIKGLAVALAIASFNLAAEQPRFAEDFPKGVGYAVVFMIVPDEDGMAKTCAFDSAHELTEEAPLKQISPPDAYVIDACRKLHNGKWPVKRDESGNIEADFYFCRHVESAPNMAFCDRQFGE